MLIRWLTETWARLRLERSPLQLVMIVLLAGCVLVAGVFVFISAFPGKPAFFVVNAQTEYLEINGFDADSSIVLDGFAVCYDRENAEVASTLVPTPETPCGAQERLLRVPQGAALDVAPESLAFVRRLNQGALEVVVSGVIRSHQDGERRSWVLRAFEPLDHTIGFDLNPSGWVHLGQIPDPGIEGVLIGGDMSAYQKGLVGRFLVDSTDLIAGDVVNVILSGDNVARCPAADGDGEGIEKQETNPIQGFFRFETPELEGLRVVVYVLCSDRLIVERMGTRFPFQVTWTAQMLGNPFSTAVLAFVSWLGCLAAVVALVVGPIEKRDAHDWRDSRRADDDRPGTGSEPAGAKGADAAKR